MGECVGFSIKKIGYPLLIPGILIIISCIMVFWLNGANNNKSGAFLLILPVLPYALFGAGIIMGWRYGNTGMILASFVLALSYMCFIKSPDGSGAGANMSMHAAISFLLPLNMVFFSLLTKRRMLTTIGVAATIILVFQVLAASVFCEPGVSRIIDTANSMSPQWGARFSNAATWLGLIFSNHSPLGFTNLARPGQLAFSWALIFLLARLYFAADPLAPGFFGALLAVFIGICVGSEQSYMIFFFAAGLILLITSIEAAFSMAYVDELTGLQGRRSLDETMLNLGKQYVIAMIDIDHFKKFNDSYGHKTGDQVLKMIAKKLSHMGGGAKTFRYGGEEFTAIFPGKEIFESLPHIEKYRQTIESMPFMVRSKARKKSTAKSRGKGPGPNAKRVKVTVSIGVSQPNKKGLTRPDQVIKAADKILYKAKKAGRNCVKT